MIPKFGEDAVFIWGAYGAVILGLALMLVGSFMVTRSARKALERLERAEDSDTP